jgi:copper chaperone CopZ/thiol-disulfide isomerase/thioredoxin
MRRALFSLFLLVAAAPAFADRVQVFSIQGADCSTCAEKIKDELKKTKGVGKVEFDKQKVELTVKLDDGVGDEVVTSAVERAGFKAIAGAGQGAYLPHPEYPAGADVAWLSRDGSAVGPLPKLRVPAKYTVFDVYADWCGPCREVDERLRDIVAARPDVAVRKLNVVEFESPLGKELGSRLAALPYVIVFTPSGKRIDIAGVDMAKLDKALAGK